MGFTVPVCLAGERRGHADQGRADVRSTRCRLVRALRAVGQPRATRRRRGRASSCDTVPSCLGAPIPWRMACEGRHVALFDANVAAPAELSLAGIARNAGPRAKTKCLVGDLSSVDLLREDAVTSSKDVGTPYDTALLCGLCAEAYDARRVDLGCAVCASRLAVGDIEHDLQDGVPRCAQCLLAAAVDAARAPLLAELEEARATTAPG